LAQAEHGLVIAHPFPQSPERLKYAATYAEQTRGICLSFFERLIGR
jgi:hypothetical protein